MNKTDNYNQFGKSYHRDIYKVLPCPEEIEIETISEIGLGKLGKDSQNEGCLSCYI